MTSARELKDVNWLHSGEPDVPSLDFNMDSAGEPTFSNNPTRPSLQIVYDVTSDTNELLANDQLDNSAREMGDALELDHENKHCHKRHILDTRTARNQLIIVSCLCFVFMCAEIMGGILSGSLALLTDAAHLACDLTGFLVSLIAIWLATKPATIRLSFGFHRAEVLGAIISVLIIWVVTAVLVVVAVFRVIHKDYDINANMMLIIASMGLAFNIIMGMVLHTGACKCQHHHGFLHGHSHGGSHGQSHDNGHVSSEDTDYTVQIRSTHSPEDATETHEESSGDQNTNINVRAAMVHVIGDLIQSVGVLVAAIIIKFKPEYQIADPICTFIFSALVLCTTVTVLRDACMVLMEGVPRGLDYKTIKFDLEQIVGVRSAHSLNVWSLTLGKLAMTVHLAVDLDTTERWEVLEEATNLLQTKHNAFQTTIQIEPYVEITMMNCEQCRPPKGC